MLQEQQKIDSFSDWVVRHQAKVEQQEDKLPIKPDEVLLFVADEKASSFGRIGFINRVDFTEDEGGHNLVWIKFPVDGKGEPYDARLLQNGSLKVIYRKHLSPQDQTLITAYDSRVSALL